MKTKTENILTVMRVLSWIVFIGLLIKFGGIAVSYVLSTANPEAAKNIYLGLDLFSLRESDLWQYTMVVSLILSLTALKAYTAYLAIKILSKINMANPFTMHIARLIEKVSHLIVGTWIVAMIANEHMDWLNKSGFSFQENMNSGEFLFLAGVIFIIAQVFKKGVEIQSENALTI